MKRNLRNRYRRSPFLQKSRRAIGTIAAIWFGISFVTIGWFWDVLPTWVLVIVFAPTLIFVGALTLLFPLWIISDLIVGLGELNQKIRNRLKHLL